MGAPVRKKNMLAEANMTAVVVVISAVVICRIASSESGVIAGR